jgi:hypothetical protein
MKMLGREPALWGQGVTATSMGIEAAVEKIRGWVTDPKHRRVVFVGSRRLLGYVDFIERQRAPSVDVQYVVEPILGVDELRPAHPKVTIGTVVELRGEARLESVVIEASGGGRRMLDGVDLLVIDFMSYELSPSRTFACPSLALDADGYVQVDRRQRTNIEGLFAAGDVTGMPACAGTAIGEGIVAGFEAYRYVYRQKFDAEPPLFAYYGWEGELQEGFHELPRFAEDAFGPEMLSRLEESLETALSKFPPAEQTAVERTLRAIAPTGGALLSLRQLADRTGQEVASVRRIVERLLELKLITLQACDG